MSSTSCKIITAECNTDPLEAVDDHFVQLLEKVKNVLQSRVIT
jgi:hypothetical protein